MKQILISLLLVLFAGQAVACSCVSHGSITRWEYDHTEYIFIGKVEELIGYPEAKKKSEDTSGYQIEETVMLEGYNLVINPIKIYKGTPNSDGKFVLNTRAQSTACGLTIKAGQYLLAFSNGYISKCSRYEKFKAISKNADSIQLELADWINHHEYDSVLKALGAPMKDGIYDEFGVTGLVRNGNREGRWDYTGLYSMGKMAIPIGFKPELPILASSFYSNNTLDSIYYYENKIIEKIERYRGDKLVGWQETFLEGKIASRSLYNDKSELVERWEYTSNGIVSMHLYVNNGTQIEEQIDTETGRPWRRLTSLDNMQRVEILDSLGRAYIEGSYRLRPNREYYDNDLYLNTYIRNQHDTLVKNGNGIFVDYYPNNKKRIEFWVKNGKICQQLKAWHPNGRLAEKMYFLDKEPYSPITESCDLLPNSDFYLETFVPCKTNKAWHANGKCYYTKRYGRKGAKEYREYKTPLLVRIGLKKIKMLKLEEQIPVKAFEEE